MKTIFHFLLIVLVLSLTACHKDYDINIIDKNAMSLNFEVNGEPLEIALNSSSLYFDAVTLNTDFSTLFVLKNVSDFNYVKVNGVQITSMEGVRLKLNKIAYNEYIAVEYSIGNDSKTVYIRTLNSTIPTLHCAGQSPYEGDYYLSFVYNTSIVKINGEGDIVYYRCVAKDALAPTSLLNPPGYWDFKKHNVNGQVYYSFNECNNAFVNLQFSGYSPGARVIMDEQYRIIDRIYLSASSMVHSGDPTEGHDFYMIDRDHYIVSNYVLRIVSPSKFPEGVKCNPRGSKVVSSYLQEIKNGSVVFDWWSVDHKEFFVLSDTSAFQKSNFDFMNETSQAPDYVHFNSIEIDPKDNNLICSFRHVSTIVKIDRKTGNILWKLSGNGDEFGLTDAQKTHGQHYVRLTKDGWITVFDNHNCPEGGKTRIVKYKIDEQNKRLVDFVEYHDGMYTTLACGSAIKIDDNADVFVIGWGISNSPTPRVLSEINFNTNEKYFEITLSQQSSVFSTPTYRSVKYK